MSKYPCDANEEIVHTYNFQDGFESKFFGGLKAMLGKLEIMIMNRIPF